MAAGRADSVAIGTRVRVYWHSHRRRFSVVAGRGSGRVTAHAREVWVEGARFVVRPGGRDRVRATGRKSPHAFVEGTAAAPGPVDAPGSVEVVYNPNRDDAFRELGGGMRPVAAAGLVGMRVIDAHWACVLAWGVEYAEGGGRDG